MTPSLNFLVLALAVVVLPVAVLRFSGLKGLVPLVVVQIMVGIALGPSVFGRVAPNCFRCTLILHRWRPLRVSPRSRF